MGERLGGPLVARSSVGRNYRLLNCGASEPGCYAAIIAAGAGPGFQGSGMKRANRTIFSDPQSPQRRPADVETVSQFSQ